MIPIVGKTNNIHFPEDVPTLIPGTCGYVTLDGKGKQRPRGNSGCSLADLTKGGSAEVPRCSNIVGKALQGGGGGRSEGTPGDTLWWLSWKVEGTQGKEYDQPL